jgi:hypothetical protein
MDLLSAYDAALGLAEEAGLVFVGREEAGGEPPNARRRR